MADFVKSSIGIPAASSLSTNSDIDIQNPPHSVITTIEDLNALLFGPPGVRGLGVMTSLLQSEDRRFNSCRTHQ